MASSAGGAGPDGLLAEPVVGQHQQDGVEPAEAKAAAPGRRRACSRIRAGGLAGSIGGHCGLGRQAADGEPKPAIRTVTGMCPVCHDTRFTA